MVTTKVRTGDDDPVDVHIGHRLRLAREIAGISQQALGDALGVTFQQIQKYEQGKNRLTGARVFDASRACGVTPSYFFEDMDPDMLAARDALLGRQTTPLADVTLSAVMGDPGIVDHIVCLRALPIEHRRAVERMVRALAGRDNVAEAPETQA